jgi:hypothetical protein
MRPEVKHMPAMQIAGEAHVGDWLEARGIHGEPPRRGQIVETLGSIGHPHYRVRWDEQHESLVYPADGVIIVPQRRYVGHPHAG